MPTGGCEVQAEQPSDLPAYPVRFKPLLGCPPDMILLVRLLGGAMVKPSTTKLSSRGQVVIPEEIRNRLGLEPGDQFVVVGEGNVVILKTVEPPDAKEIKALLDRVQKAAKEAGITPEDVERAIREVRGSK
jgi:AbrB family looped-hinge helix DNA binding protein